MRNPQRLRRGVLGVPLLAEEDSRRRRDVDHAVLRHCLLAVVGKGRDADFTAAEGIGVEFVCGLVDDDLPAARADENGRGRRALLPSSTVV